MNIFAIEGDEKTGKIDWRKSGHTQDNYRTVKMLLESTQLLSSAMHLNGMQGPYKLNHAKHPSTLWAAESFNNWSNLMIHALALASEYRQRFGKIHKCVEVLSSMNKVVDSSKFPTNKPTPLRLAMPDEFRTDNPVKSYRDYYVTKERMRYPKDKVPDWFIQRRKLPFVVV